MIIGRSSCSNALGYDLTNYHLFMDDMQHMDFRESSTHTYYDVGDFIEQTFITCVQWNTYLWVMLDVPQGWIDLNSNRGYSSGLFFNREDLPRLFLIPIVKLSYAMRSSNEIMNFTNEAREKYLKIVHVSSETTSY